ncbi:hypothetical protein P872_12170 [Rhodonellum psychrophilum GCM71 = DSM 17998]|uniref:Uncharacterized protein n=2 Tax=Rhodonellum TaxID=336827 RepID=U5BSG1_9BACT|nr:MULTISPECIES: hypothetical protein [Rhodonellum]ERM80823.1 hypothetical protein P872_12170 [Rhodonellum psychrophilum GCM71 = DSM 17998]MDO9553355.1 hypothetical protein [Rhodonellum sp.]SDZ24014.1 hypothetical protein SAMN05444412_10870 [Rhodonellum ikkaensis]
MATVSNAMWNLESFIDSLVVELDKARETLAIKAINKPLTYTVKDVGLDLHLFPTYNGDEVKFITAQPGQSGASRLSIQLGSITDQQIRQTTREPVSKDAITIDKIDVDNETRKSLRKMGVTSVNDLEKLENKNVDIANVSNNKISYKNLADIIKKSKRHSTPPSVGKVSLNMSGAKPIIIVDGNNLHLDAGFEPVAVVNNKLVHVLTSDNRKLEIEVGPDTLKKGKNELVMTLDPFAIFKIDINQQDNEREQRKTF